MGGTELGRARKSMRSGKAAHAQSQPFTVWTSCLYVIDELNASGSELQLDQPTMGTIIKGVTT